MSSDAVLVTVTDESAYAGNDFVACGDAVERCTEISAIGALSGIGSWSSPNSTITFAAPTQATTTACNLLPGANILVWTINGGACGHHAVDSVIVNFAILTAADDEVSIPFIGTGFVNVLFNDNVLGTASVSILEPPAHGTLEVGLNGVLTYEADINFVGQDVAIYQVCQEGCACATATITFNVGKNALGFEHCAVNL